MNSSNKGRVVVGLSEQGSIDDQAAHWVARLDSDELSETTLADFKRWLKQSAEHRQAYEDYVELWDGMNVATELVPPSQSRHAGRRLNQTFARSWLAMASVLVVALLSFQFLNSPLEEVYATAVGEQRSYTLPDGSSALLNTNTRLKVRYTGERRLIDLQQGEAHFAVERDVGRPFEVMAGQGVVRAIGTAFTVYLRSDDVEVVVTEGVVEIGAMAAEDSAAELEVASPSSEQASSPSRVKAGVFATYDRHTAKHVLLAELEKLEQKTAWQQGLLMFENEPLENVVAEVGRYTDTKILIPEEHVRQLKVDGHFKVGDIEAMFEALKISFNIEAEVVSEGVIYLVLKEKQ